MSEADECSGLLDYCRLHELLYMIEASECFVEKNYSVDFGSLNKIEVFEITYYFGTADFRGSPLLSRADAGNPSLFNDVETTSIRVRMTIWSMRETREEGQVQ